MTKQKTLVEKKSADAQAIKLALDYLHSEAVLAGYGFVAHLIGAASEAVTMQRQANGAGTDRTPAKRRRGRRTPRAAAMPSANDESAER